MTPTTEGAAMRDAVGRGAPKIILMREGVLASWAKDGVTLGMLFALPWFNYRFCGGSTWISAAIAFAWFISIFARSSSARKDATKTPAEARAWLDEHYPETGR